jgi:hypothetical protein
MAESGKVSTGRQTHHAASMKRIPWAMVSRRVPETPIALSDDSTAPGNSSGGVTANDPEMLEVGEKYGLKSRP